MDMEGLMRALASASDDDSQGGREAVARAIGEALSESLPIPPGMGFDVERFAADMVAQHGGGRGGRSSSGEREIQPDENAVMVPGSHVRVVGTSLGAGGVEIGDIGVIKKLTLSGGNRYLIVNFPGIDNDWKASITDVMLDFHADQIRPGQRVHIKESFDLPMGDLGYEHIGLVHTVSPKGEVEVQFGLSPTEPANENLWKGRLQDLVVVGEMETLDPLCGAADSAIYPFDIIRVRPEVVEPTTQWGSLTHSSLGVARGEVQGHLVGDFPEQSPFYCLIAELIRDPITSLIRPGCWVKTRSSVTVPQAGWAQGQNHSTLGLVRSVSYTGHEVEVDFPNSRNFRCMLSELEVTSPPPGGTCGPVPACWCGVGLTESPTAREYGRLCDLCGISSGPVGSSFFTCMTCDFDMCPSCHSTPGLSPVRPRPAASFSHAAQNQPGARLVLPPGGVRTSTAPPLRRVPTAEHGDISVPMVDIEDMIAVEAIPRKFEYGAIVKLSGLLASPLSPLDGTVARVTDLITSRPAEWGSPTSGDRYIVQLLAHDHFEVLVPEGNLSLEELEELE